MKKLIALLLALMLPCAALADGVVNVFNWEEYIDESVLEEFTARTGVKVNYMCFTTNEDMMLSVETGVANNFGYYDVVFPSEYMVQRMTNKGMLQEIDFSKITNIGQIQTNLMNASYDPTGTHSIPYMWGTLGILYNTELVDEEDVKTWGVLWNEKYKGQILMMESQRDAIGIALKYLGYSMNSNDYTQLREATDLLIKLKTSGQVKAWGLDEFKDKMVAGEAAMAVVYSGDAQYAIDLNDKLAYAIPMEGTNIWTDAIVIPADARNVENAHLFIDFLCDPEIAARNCEEIWYCSPNTGAIEIMGEEYTSSPVMNPTEEEVARCEYFNDLDPAWLTIYNQLWQDVRNAK